MRRPIAIISMLMLLIVPITPMAGAVDTNELVFDNIWPFLGPGGETDEVITPLLEDGDLAAEPMGGELTSSETAGGDPTHTLSGFVCTAPNPAEPGSDFDLEMSSPNPFFHSSLENGIFEATGSFFVDVEIDGDDADDVEEVHFGFAHTFPWPASSALCSGAFPMPGAYYEFYRGDTDGSDGWEIPVNTLLVPDFAYGAILRALDSQGNVMAAAFVYANVNNYADDENWQPGTPTTCDQTDEQGELLCPYQDVTPPFPTVDNCTDGVLFSYGEPLEDFIVSTGDSNPVPENQIEERDVDSVPLVQVQGEAWGPEYCVTGASGELTVTAVDQLGNIGKRTVTV